MTLKPLFLIRNLKTRLYWRASVASETLTGVTQSKIEDVCLFIYMFGRMYVILGRGRTRSEHKNTDGQCSLRVRPRPNSLNGILRFSDHYPYHLRN